MRRFTQAEEVRALSPLRPLLVGKAVLVAVDECVIANDAVRHQCLDRLEALHLIVAALVVQRGALATCLVGLLAMTPEVRHVLPRHPVIVGEAVLVGVHHRLVVDGARLGNTEAGCGAVLSGGRWAPVR